MSNLRGLDYAGGRPNPAAIRSAGYTFVVRYLSSGGASLPGKLLTPDEADGLRAAGVEIVSNWETTADRMRDGWSAGAGDASAALAQVLRCGGRQDRPIYFSADWDVSEDEQAQVDDYLRGAASVLGPEWVGIYGGYWPVSRALDSGTARWGWQAQAWSGGNVDPRAQLLQLNNDGYAWIGSIQCDINEAAVPDYGQWSYVKEDKVADMDVTGDIREQLTGARDEGYPGWAQLGGRTVVDALGAIGEKLGISGCADVKGGDVDAGNSVG